MQHDSAVSLAPAAAAKRSPFISSQAPAARRSRNTDARRRDALRRRETAGSTACRSGLRPIQRTSVDRPIPRSPAISRCVRPLVCTRRTASSANSFVNRRCCVIEFLIAHGELSTFPKQVQAEADAVFSARMKPIWHKADIAGGILRGARRQRGISPTLSPALRCSARQTLLCQGWLPWRLPNATSYSPQEDRCPGRPEMLTCDAAIRHDGRRSAISQNLTMRPGRHPTARSGAS